MPHATAERHLAHPGLPGARSVAIVLLDELVALGGSATSKTAQAAVTRRFQELKPEQLEAELPSGGNAWINRINWARYLLASRSLVDSPRTGLWRLTAQGAEAVKQGTAADRLRTPRLP